MAKRKSYPSDISDEEWYFAARTSRLSGRTPPNVNTLFERFSTDWEMDVENRLAVEVHTPRTSPVGGWLPADAALDKSGSGLGDGPRFVRTPAALEGKGFGAFCGRTGIAHAEKHPRARLGTATTGRRKRRVSKVHAAVDTFGHLLALRVRPDNGDERKEVEKLSVEIQEATGDSVELTYVDQGYTGQKASAAAAKHGI